MNLFESFFDYRKELIDFPLFVIPTTVERKINGSSTPCPLKQLMTLRIHKSSYLFKCLKKEFCL